MGIFGKAKHFLKECVRIMKIISKPNKKEYLTVVKVAGLGILAIGFIGFLFTITKQLLF